MNLNEKINEVTKELKYPKNHTHLLSLKNELQSLQDRQEIVDWMKSSPTRYHLNITFAKDLNEFHAENYVNVLWKQIRNEYFGNNHKQDFLKGFIIREMKEDKSIHYHLMIEDHGVFNAKRNQGKIFEDVISEKCGRIVETYPGKNGETVNKHPIHPNQGFELQDYYEEKLEEYLTKTMEWNGLRKEFFAPLTYDGFTFDDKSREISFRH